MRYDYKCLAEGVVFEVEQKLADEPLTICPTCSGPVKKVPVAINFELVGGGWPGKRFKAQN